MSLTQSQKLVQLANMRQFLDNLRSEAAEGHISCRLCDELVPEGDDIDGLCEDCALDAALFDSLFNEES